MLGHPVQVQILKMIYVFQFKTGTTGKYKCV